MKVSKLLEIDPHKSGSINLHIEIYQENSDCYIFLSEDSSSGATYKVNTVKDIVERIKLYLNSRYDKSIREQGQNYSKEFPDELKLSLRT